jgi:hypothetical protein
MKNLKMLVLVVALAFSSVLSASTNPIEKVEPASISKTVQKLLKNPSFQLKENVSAMVEVLINQDNEMVVLSVDTNSKLVEHYIKRRLNYKKLPKETIVDSKKFKIPVTILESI